MSEENPNALKHMFNKELLEKTANSFKQVYPEFDKKAFVHISKRFPELEMKPRVYLIRDTLAEQLPKNFPTALKILLDATEKGDLTGFNLWPITEFIQKFGLKHLQISLLALQKLTTLFTSEFAIRPFLNHHTEETLTFLIECAKSDSVHIRRWASEGSRPRLPWGEKLHQFIVTPKHTLPILELLKHDEELYVRKSVANHLNDISKDHPQFVLKLLAKWKRSSAKRHQQKIDWIIKHSLRTLIKKGDAKALELIGVKEAQIKVRYLKLNKNHFQLNDILTFEFKIKSLTPLPQKLVIDYKIHFMKANGENSPKVFKLKVLNLAANEEMTIQKNHHLRPVTTRVYYPGKHYIEIQINGQTFMKTGWHLNT